MKFTEMLTHPTTPLRAILLPALTLLLASHAWAYNQDHRPFTPNSWPPSLALETILGPDEISSPNGSTSSFAFTVPGEPEFRFRIFPRNDFTSVDLYADDHEILPETPFGASVSFSHFTLQQADLNQDGAPDYILSSWLGGVGLASGYFDLAIFLSTGSAYILAPISVLWPEPTDYVRINGTPCLIHTSFHEVEKCTDGKSHNFWVYNLLAFDGPRIQVANQLLPGFPKIVWYSHAPRHDETTLLSPAQKAKIHADSLNSIFWHSAAVSPSTPK